MVARQPDVLPPEPTSTTVAPTATPTALPTLPPSPTPTATPIPPTATPAPPRVGIQVGHWKTEELPDELARLRTSVGAIVGGYTELQVNLDIAQRVVALLEQQGVVVDLLPATIPPAYLADAFVSLHADGSTSTGRRGYKLATPWRTSRASAHLYNAMQAEYGAATGLPLDDAITFNMRGYYAFSYNRHTHAIARTTPAVIMEMGFLSNPQDRAFMLERADTVAQGIVNGILRYLNERDPTDLAALEPPNFDRREVLPGSTIPVYATASENSAILITASEGFTITPFEEREGWYYAFVRGQDQRVVGWISKARYESQARVATPTVTNP
ncbi:MAG: N-acetylmuramoyl-L-alanine amidase [Blastochloris sp.]|nr:N-acetylmuramoyl-L-alanine amidase [Blastochloris sp.]